MMKIQSTHILYFRHLRAQRGNALFLILIAVALFAALSYAITQSGRGGGNISKEQAAISAAQITQFPASIRTVVTRMMVTGTAASDIDFDTSATGSDAVFASDGGGAAYVAPPNNIGNAYGGATGTTAGTWGFKDIKDPVNGYYIRGVGTDTDVTGRDAFAYLSDISLSVCQQINKGLGITIDLGGGMIVDYEQNGGKGAAVFQDDSNHFWDVGADGVGNSFACVANGGGGTLLDYYHAMIEQ